MVIIIILCVSIVYSKFGFGVLEDNFVSRMYTSYDSATQFISFYALLNLYLYIMVYVYTPCAGREVKLREKWMGYGIALKYIILWMKKLDNYTRIGKTTIKTQLHTLRQIQYQSAPTKEAVLGLVNSDPIGCCLLNRSHNIYFVLFNFLGTKDA